MNDPSKGRAPSRSERQGAGPGEDMAWSIISTLLAGPLVWGAVGALVDHLANTERVFLPIGIALGFGLAFYIVYVRYGRN